MQSKNSLVRAIDGNQRAADLPPELALGIDDFSLLAGQQTLHAQCAAEGGGRLGTHGWRMELWEEPDEACFLFRRYAIVRQVRPFISGTPAALAYRLLDGWVGWRHGMTDPCFLTLCLLATVGADWLGLSRFGGGWL